MKTMKMYGLQSMSLKIWIVEDLDDKFNECFIRIRYNYLESSKYIRVVFIKRSWYKCWTLFWCDNNFKLFKGK